MIHPSYYLLNPPLMGFSFDQDNTHTCISLSQNLRPPRGIKPKGLVLENNLISCPTLFCQGVYKDWPNFTYFAL